MHRSPWPSFGALPAGLLSTAFGGLLVACGGGDDGAAPTYTADIAPLVQENCVACHQRGGIGPFRLDSYEALTGGGGDVAELALREIEADRMPPWLPDPACRTFRNQRILTPDQKATFRRWVTSGMPRGEGELTVAPADPNQDDGVAFPATHRLPVSDGYTPDPDRNDDYRCFILDVDGSEDLYLRGTRVVPDADAIVHHVLLYALEPSQRSLVEEADAAEEGPGYTCFGAPLPSMGEGADGLVDTISGSGFGLPQTLAGWVPGMEPEMQDPGAATRIPAGSPLVVQMHYNLLTSDPVEDATVVELILDDQQPEVLTTMRPAAILDLDIPAGDPAARHELTFRNHGDEDIRIRSLLAHMHLLGKEMNATVVRGDGQESCLLDIPEWEFDWQQSYALPPGGDEVLAPGDGFRLSCVHDNSRENQPIVDGARLPPVDVEWGDGSLDEMCLMYFETVEPFAPRPSSPAPTCAASADCLAGCDGSTTDCLLGCEELDFDCAVCSIGGLVECAATPTRCGLPFLQAQDCLFSCGTNSLLLAGSIGRCMSRECPDAYAALTGCLDNEVTAPACNAALDACGVSIGE